MDIKNKFLKVLAEKYPTRQAACREIINLNAILNLPKGTEHFMSDLHGEYEAFYHIVNNCSGVIREKIRYLFDDKLSELEQQELCTLIYYPKEKLQLLENQKALSDDWYRMTLYQLIEIAKLLSSKYTRSKVRKAMPADFSYIIDELLHVQKDEDDNQVHYHLKIMDTILMIHNGDEFLIALADLIKRLAVDHLHIIGDIYDRGTSADKIMDLLMAHHSIDIQWGNHDVLWMGAACGNPVCAAQVIQSNLKYQNPSILENEYGICLRELVIFAQKTYRESDPMKASFQAMTVILFKLEGSLLKDHPEYGMADRLLLEYINPDMGDFSKDGKTYNMRQTDFPTLDESNPYQLTLKEDEIMENLRLDFLHSSRLKEHMTFLYEKGSVYKVYNQNLLDHGCVPLDDQGNFDIIELYGKKYKGKDYFDYVDSMIRKAWNGNKNAIDFMWFLWGSIKSPLTGRRIRTFERTWLLDSTAWDEEKNPYYSFYKDEKTCNMILRDFGLYSDQSHIINGHTPVRAKDGELPIRANGKLIVIDGGFCRRYHDTTGIAGYTLIYNSHGLRLKAHQPFESVQKAITENLDIDSDSVIVEEEKQRVMVKDTDIGQQIQEDLNDLTELLKLY